jgi:hypothetical protein
MENGPMVTDHVRYEDIRDWQRLGEPVTVRTARAEVDG